MASLPQESPRLVVVLGLPGTGKTTFASALSGRIGAAHLNTDIIRTHMGMRGHYSPEDKAAIYEALFRQCREGLGAGKQVILDGTFYKEALRDPIRSLAKEAGVKLAWILLEADPDLVRERVSKARPFTEADFKVYQQVRGEYEPLLSEHLRLQSDRQQMEAMLDEAVKYLVP